MKQHLPGGTEGTGHLGGEWNRTHKNARFTVSQTTSVWFISIVLGFYCTELSLGPLYFKFLLHIVVSTHCFYALSRTPLEESSAEERAASYDTEAGECDWPQDTGMSLLIRNLNDVTATAQFVS